MFELNELPGEGGAQMGHSLNSSEALATGIMWNLCPF